MEVMACLEKAQLEAISLKELIIPADKVAHVQVGNPLEHALLVLIKSGYSAVPVLDSNYKLQGLISKTMILDSILGMERIEFEKLSTIKVEKVMNKEIPRLTETDSFLDALDLEIDHPFICIQDKEKYFEGILTRRAILKYFRKMIYQGKQG